MFLTINLCNHAKLKCPRGVMVKPLDCRIVVREFELQSCCYVHFRTHTLEVIKPLIFSAMG